MGSPLAHHECLYIFPLHENIEIAIALTGEGASNWMPFREPREEDGGNTSVPLSITSDKNSKVSYFRS